MCRRPVRPRAVHVFMDLWGVLLDAERMQREYGPALARHLAAEFGGAEAEWTVAHTAAWTDYVRETESTDWGREPWSTIADRLDARFALGILERMDVRWRPPDPAGFSRDLDRRVMSTVNARYPDAEAAVQRLKAAGHGVYVATQATDSNARGALEGAKLLGSLDGLYTGTSQDALKSQAVYWQRILQGFWAPADQCVVVDDRVDYLTAATSLGFLGLLLDREGVYESTPIPSCARAALRNLAGLPHFVDVLASEV